MEDEKKKKKNKKKKNKPTKTADSVIVSVIESTSVDEYHAAENGQSSFGQVSEAADFQNDVVRKPVVDLDAHHANDTKDSIFPEEKQCLLAREASLAEKIKELQKEKESQVLKEAILEDKIKQLEKEKDARMQKEAILEEKIEQLQQEKAAHLQKEDEFEEKISQLVDETATLSLKRVSLEEKVKQMDKDRDYWVQKENSTKETIAILDGEKTKLQAQVRELEESRNSLLQDNQQLIETISGLHSKIQSLESTASLHSSIKNTMHASENGDMETQMEIAPVEKLTTENAELDEKVNELYVELDQRIATTELPSSVGAGAVVGGTDLSAYVTESSAIGSDPMVGTAARHETAPAADPMLEVGERMPVSGETMESVQDVFIKDERNGSDSMNADYTSVVPNPSETIESEEIVQIPLDESEVQDTDSEAAHNEEEADVPLLDAPLIGAPFRLISFFARYVSGADLVDNKSFVNSGR
ncbi:unnamed protein product [Ilex paraguariensis]|uniref:Uncharacterized protein n=1 Tax=Ilex paraguariensis TaxID=185542 RepID=A0ABC8RBJ3_9AQUA